MVRLRKENFLPSSSSDTLDLDVSINFTYRKNTVTPDRGNFADCILNLILKNKTSSLKYENAYSLSNYKLLGEWFPSKLDANKDLISNRFNQALSQFFIGHFPLTGEIIKVTEKNKKKDEAKMVKINLGAKDGIFIGYSFVVTDIDNTSTKADIVVIEKFIDYSLCKVEFNENKIFQNLIAGKKLKIKTIYKP